MAQPVLESKRVPGDLNITDLSSSGNVSVQASLMETEFFQAEDGIRDIGVTGVQTCALPISIKETCAETMIDEERSVILRSPRTRLLLLGQVEPTKLQEGTYL